MSPLLPVVKMSPELEAYLVIEKEMKALVDGVPDGISEKLDELLDKMDVAWSKLNDADIDWLNRRKVQL